VQGCCTRISHAKQQSYSCGTLFRRKNTPLKDPSAQRHVLCRAREHNPIVGRKRPDDPPPCCQGGRSRWNCKTTLAIVKKDRAFFFHAPPQICRCRVSDKGVLPISGLRIRFYARSSHDPLHNFRWTPSDLRNQPRRIRCSSDADSGAD